MGFAAVTPCVPLGGIGWERTGLHQTQPCVHSAKSSCSRPDRNQIRKRGKQAQFLNRHCQTALVDVQPVLLLGQRTFSVDQLQVAQQADVTVCAGPRNLQPRLGNIDRQHLQAQETRYLQTAVCRLHKAGCNSFDEV